MALPISTVFISGLALWLLVLSINVMRLRGATNIMLSHGDNDVLLSRIRAQGNFVEYAPIMAIMVAVAEVQNGNFWILSGSAFLFFAARLLHGYALSFAAGAPTARLIGAALSVLTMAMMAIYNLVLALS